MAALFVSHSSSDLAATKRVVERLAAEGFAALFLDFDPVHGLPAGRAWESELYAQLRKADGVVFLGSAASVASQWCFAEISLARSLGKPVFPLRLEAGVRLGLLDDVQWIDLSEGETAFARLWAGLRRAGLDPADSFAWDPTRSPYPGLEVLHAARMPPCSLAAIMRSRGWWSCCSRLCSAEPAASLPSSAPRAAASPRCCEPGCCRVWSVCTRVGWYCRRWCRANSRLATWRIAWLLPSPPVASRGPLEEIAAALGRGGAGLVELAVELGELAARRCTAGLLAAASMYWLLSIRQRSFSHVPGFANSKRS